MLLVVVDCTCRVDSEQVQNQAYAELIFQNILWHLHDLLHAFLIVRLLNIS